ncbi:MAG: hypothetical protein ACP5NQ_05105, partial [Vulcanisaeta sp.]
RDIDMGFLNIFVDGNLQRRDLRYLIEVRGVKLEVSYELGYWSICDVTDESSPRYIRSFKKASDIIINRRIFKEIYRYVLNRLGLKESELPEVKVKEALEKYFLSRVRVRKSPIPSTSRVLWLHLPLDYIDELGVAAALSYEVVARGDATLRRPVVLLSHPDGRVERVDVIDLLRGITITGQDGRQYIITLDSSIFQLQGSEDEITNVERAFSNAIDSLLKMQQDSLPTMSDILYWINEVKNSGVSEFEWLQAFVRQLSEFVQGYVWGGVASTEKKLISLLASLDLVSAVVDFIIKIIFSSKTPGSGKSYHIALITRFLSYATFLENASAATLTRILDATSTVALDDPHIDEGLVKMLIQSFRKDAMRAITIVSENRVTTLRYGGIILMPDLAGKTVELDIHGAAGSRAMIINLTKDRRIAVIVDMYKELRNKTFNLTIRGKTYGVPISSIYALKIALFLLNARRLRELYKQINSEVVALARDDKLGIDPRLIQTFASLLLLARIAGKDYEDSVWDYMRGRDVRYGSEPFDVLLDIVEAVLSDAGNSDAEENAEDNTEDSGTGDLRNLIEEVKSKYGYEANGIVLLRPAGLLQVAIAMREAMSGVPLIVDRLRVEGGQNAVMRDVERWVRRALPEEFQNEKRIEMFLSTTPYLKDLFIKARQKGGGKHLGHLIITRDLPQLITYIESGQTREAEELTNEILCEAYRALDDLINDGTVLMPRLDCPEQLNAPPPGEACDGTKEGTMGDAWKVQGGHGEGTMEGTMDGTMRGEPHEAANLEGTKEGTMEGTTTSNDANSNSKPVESAPPSVPSIVPSHRTIHASQGGGVENSEGPLGQGVERVSVKELLKELGNVKKRGGGESKSNEASGEGEVE